MSRILRIVLIALLILVPAGLLVPVIFKARVQSDRVGCQNHLRELGLIGVRHAAPPGQGLPTVPRDELPAGTFLSADLSPERRMSWYTYLINVFHEGVPDPQAKQRPRSGLAELLKGFTATEPWDSLANRPLADYRLTTAICPAQVLPLVAGQPVLTNYFAAGGLGLDTPTLSPETAGPKGGAYWYDGPTPDRLFRDGLHQTAQIVESNWELGPWLQGGPATVRGLDVAAQPYVGGDRPFGGCHPGGVYASMADGSVRFIKDTVDSAIFRALLTRAGGVDELGIDGP